VKDPNRHPILGSMPLEGLGSAGRHDQVDPSPPLCSGSG